MRIKHRSRQGESFARAGVEGEHRHGSLICLGIFHKVQSSLVFLSSVIASSFLLSLIAGAAGMRAISHSAPFAPRTGRREQLNSRLITISPATTCPKKTKREAQRAKGAKHTTGTRLMTRQTMGTIMLSKMTKLRRREEWRGNKLRKNVENKKVAECERREPARAVRFTRTHSWGEAGAKDGKLNFTLIYLFMALTTRNSSLCLGSQPIFHTFTLHRDGTGRRRWDERRTEGE
jgi:hypothetical protein